jgi:hypothetical protein
MVVGAVVLVVVACSRTPASAPNCRLFDNPKSGGKGERLGALDAFTPLGVYAEAAEAVQGQGVHIATRGSS